MTNEIQTVMAGATLAGGIVVWLVRLEASVKRAHERHEDLKSDLKEIKIDVKKIRSFMGGGER